MSALIALLAVALAAAPTAKKKQPTPEPAPEAAAPTTAAGRGPQLRVIKLDPQKAKAVYKVNAAPGLATVIQLPEIWTTTPTCGDCVFGDAKAETQLWRLDVFPDTRSLSIKPTRVPGADAPPSAFVTNIDVALDGGLAVTLFVELTLPESADARVEFTIPDAERGAAKLTKRERELEARFEERVGERANERLLDAFMHGTSCKDFFGRPNRKDNVVVRLKQICKNAQLVLVTFEVENRRRDEIVLDSALLETTKATPAAGDRLEKTALRFNERGLGVAAVQAAADSSPERYRLTVTVAGVDEETKVVIEDIEL
jgi:hypothetical protein